MKKLLFLSGITMLSLCAMGQAKDGTADFKKTVKADPAVMIELPYAPLVVEQALADFLTKTSKQEQRSASGYLLSCNTPLVQNNTEGADMIFK